MTDEEVGELWQSHLAHNQDARYYCEQCWLIRKLVEERAWHWTVYAPSFRPEKIPDDCWKLALRDFHIDPKTWPKEEP